MTAYEYFGAFFEELANRGVRHAVCSPGSRSAPLVLSAHAEPRLRCWVQLDERAGGFFALGLAKAERQCVALICTSGSASANYLPAVTEAFYDGVALVVLTADRPPELRDRGAGQTIDQIGLYGAHVRWSADLPVSGEVGSDHARFAAHRAVAAALGPPGGPVHLNAPLREPLEPLAGQLVRGDGGRESPGPPALPAADADEVAQLVDLVGNRERGVLAVGPSDLSGADAGAVKQLAALAGWPLLADAASGLRTGAAKGAAVVAAGQHLARTGPFWDGHAPDVIVRAGHPTAARALREGLAAWGADIWLVDPLDRWEEPATVPAGRWRSPLGALARGVLATLGSDSGDPESAQLRLDQLPPGGEGDRSRSAWARSWRLAESAAQQAITATLQGEPLLEAGLARLLGETLEPDTVLYASNSMPVRDLDAFLAPHRRAPRVVAHRGTNGVDGVVSAAAGMAAAAGDPVVLLAGDLALLHDLGGLLGAVRAGIDLTIVVPNNDGGGIFSFLPVSEAVPEPVFEQFFGTPHGADLSSVVRGVGAAHHRAADAGALVEALGACRRSGGIGVIEVLVDTAANVAQHRLVERSVRDAVARTVRTE